MVKHIVFFKLKDSSDENKQKIKDLLMTMKDQIEILKEIEVGINFSPEERAFDLSLISVFENEEDLRAYAIHPKHTPIISYLKSIETVTKVVDYRL